MIWYVFIAWNDRYSPISVTSSSSVLHEWLEHSQIKSLQCCDVVWFWSLWYSWALQNLPIWKRKVWSPWRRSAAFLTTLSQVPEATILFLFLRLRCFHSLHINDITQDWSFSVSTPTRFSHMVKSDRFPLDDQLIAYCIYNTASLSAQLTMGTEGCSHVFTTVNIAAMYLGVQAFLSCIRFILEEQNTMGNVIPESHGNPIFNYGPYPEYLHTGFFFIKSVPIYILTSSVWRFSFLYILKQRSLMSLKITFIYSFIHSFIYSFMIVYGRVHECHDLCVEVTGQLQGAESLLPHWFVSPGFYSKHCATEPITPALLSF